MTKERAANGRQDTKDRENAMTVDIRNERQRFRDCPPINEVFVAKHAPTAVRKAAQYNDLRRTALTHADIDHLIRLRNFVQDEIGETGEAVK